MINLDILYSKDNSEAYQYLLSLEALCSESNDLYDYFDELLNLIKNEKSFIRVRGFRLISHLAKWDIDNKINKNIDIILSILDDEISTSLRQCLKSLNLILIYKIELTDIIKNKLKTINVFKYKESMQKLIIKDIENILKTI